MSIHDNKYWSRRVEELATQISPTDDTTFFGSDAYREYTEDAAKNMVSGVCTYLRTLGYDITEKEEDARAANLMVGMSTDKNMTACTDGNFVTVGVCSDIVTYFDSRELKHYAIQGLRVHEIGHVLFTDFPTSARWSSALKNGNWWPNAPKRASETAGAELTQMLKNPDFAPGFEKIAAHIENAIEDGFIEREIQELYKGLATTELATTNDALISTSKTFGEMLKDKRKPFEAMFQQVLLYSKFDFTLEDGMPEEYEDVFEECIEILDDVKYERDPKKRLCGVNELCCVLYPMFKDYIENQSKSKQSGKGKKSGSGSVQNNPNSSQQGQSDGQDISQMSPSELAEAIDKAVQAAQNAAHSVGETKQENRNSESITQKVKKTAEAKKRESGKQHGNSAKNGNSANNGSQNASGKGGGDTISHERGASSGKADLSAAKADINAIEQKRKNDQATKQANSELNDELQKEADEFRKTTGTAVLVTRAEDVSSQNKAMYKRLSDGLLTITKNLERRLKTTIRDEENDDAISGLPMGTRVEARLAYHQDGKIFSRKNFPRDNPRLAVGYLCDESGSMSGAAIEASVRTGIILQDLCSRMELPCYVCGFTSGVNCGVQILSYVDKDIDGNDKYRITGMSSRSGTPTVPAMRYMGEKLKKDETEKKILIVSTDGCSNTGREGVQKAIKDLSKAGIIVVGAGIGDSRAQVEKEFGKNFIDISDLDTMPRILCNIVKKNLA
jgi:hypothetical protein